MKSLLSSSRPAAPPPPLTKTSRPTKQAPPHLVPANMATAAPLAYPSALPSRNPEGLAIEAPFDSASAASRTGRGGMMELQWGGGFGGSSAFKYFSQQNSRCGLLVRRQATINRCAAAWRKGIGCTFCRAKLSPYKIEGEGGQFGSTKRKNIIMLVWFARCSAAKSAR